MNIKDKISKFKAFALASHTTLYNEDSMTVSHLTIECNKKVAECMEYLLDLTHEVEDMKTALGLTYDSESEELTVKTIEEKVQAIKDQANATYVHIVDEDSMTAMEQVGRAMCSINECIKTINMLGDLILEIKDKTGLEYDSEAEELTVTGGIA